MIRETILEALDEAATIVKQYYRTSVAVDVKEDASPVTIADRAVERAIREIIEKRFPSCSILGEEEGFLAGKDGTFVIDPIDGTKSFLFGNPLFGTLVAFVHDDKVLAGGIGVPALGEIWYADQNQNTHLNGSPCATSECSALAKARLLSSSPDFFDPDELERFELVSGKVLYRRFGGDCYCYAQLAGGWADLVIESALKPYDYLALVPIIEQAGGLISDWQGRPLTLNSGKQVVAAATEELHQAALEILNTNR